MTAIEQTRQDALKLFNQLGLPTLRDEDWKYTDASRLQDLLEPAPTDENIHIKDMGITGLDAYRMVFINGMFAEAESDLPEGVSILSLAELEKNSVGDDAKGIAKLFAVDTQAPLLNGFNAYNAAKASDGAVIILADNTVLTKPLYILHISNQSNVVRHSFMLGKHAQAEIIEHFISTHNHQALSNACSFVALKAEAHLEHSRIQQEGGKQSHVARVQVKQCKGSSYTFHGIELGAALSRTDLVVNLHGESASCNLNGLFVLGGRQHADHHTRIDHKAPHCTSRELYRTVLNGRAHGVFNGKVMVHEGAVQTDSDMQNGNLLLSKHAEIDTKPELEIYNDDVKCAHGATVGQLDDKQLFYLRSRGVSEETAQELLTFAFADEVLVAMRNQTVRSYVEKAAFAKLPYSEDLEALLGE